MSTYKINNIRLVDNFIDNTDPTKQLKLSLENISTGTTRTLIVPNDNATIVGDDTPQTLTNKTIISPTNTVSATNLRTTGSDIVISTAAPPTIGQVLRATSATTANWQSPNNIVTGGNFIDTQTFVVDDVDPTKRAKFENSGATTGTTLTLALSQTANRTLTFPDISDTFVTRTNVETLTNKTLTSPSISTIINSGTLTLPTGTDTIVARSTADTFTNKTITDLSNTVIATGLRTATTTVVVSTATAPSTGQVLTATASNAATWQTLNTPGTIYFNNAGTVSTPTVSTIKQWYGRSTSASGIATFNITNDGTAGGTPIFPALSVTTHFFQASAQLDTTSSTAAPFASIRRVTNSSRTVEINVKTGDQGSIILGGTWNGLRNAQDGCNVYLYISGT